MHGPPSLLPSSSSCSSLDSITASSMSVPPTTNDLDDKDKQRRLKQTRKLSQILGELPWDATAQPLLGGRSALASEVPSPDLPQPHQPHVRFSRHSFIDSSSRSFRFPRPPLSEGMSAMSPHLLPSARDALGRSNSTTRRPPGRPSPISQLDLPRFGLGRLRRAESTRSNQPDESGLRAGHLPCVAETPTRSHSLRVPNQFHQARPKDKWRRRSVHDPVIVASQTPSQMPTGIPSSSTRFQRSVSLWGKKKAQKDDPTLQQRPISDQSQEYDASGNEQPPLTEAQRTQSLRRGRKLAQVSI